MTHDREVERLLDAWFADGPMHVSDRAFDEAVGRVLRQRQRPAWRLQPWRYPTMSNPIKLVAVGAALLAVLLGGVVFLGGGAGPGPTPTPTPTTTPTASVAPAATPSPPPPPTVLYGGVLAGGTYRLRPFDAAPSMTLDVTVPAGWQGFPKWALLGPGGTEAPSGVGIGFLMPAGLFSDPCRWDLAGDRSWPQQGDVVAGTTVDELVSALAANPHYVTTAATDTVVGGYPGKRMELQLPADVDFSACDRVVGDPSGVYFVWGTAEADGSDLYAQGPGSRWQLSILDVNGHRIVVVLGDYAGTPDAARAAAQAIVDSLVITP